MPSCETMAHNSNQIYLRIEKLLIFRNFEHNKNVRNRFAFSCYNMYVHISNSLKERVEKGKNCFSLCHKNNKVIERNLNSWRFSKNSTKYTTYETQNFNLISVCTEKTSNCTGIFEQIFL